MIAVLDASAGIEIVLGRAKSKAFEAVILKSEKVISSELYRAEVANVLWKYIKAKFLSKDQGFKLLAFAQDLVDAYTDIKDNNHEALIESVRLDHSVYDMLYFTLARKTGGILMTVDQKLLSLAKKQGVDVFDEPTTD